MEKKCTRKLRKSRTASYGTYRFPKRPEVADKNNSIHPRLPHKLSDWRKFSESRAVSWLAERDQLWCFSRVEYIFRVFPFVRMKGKQRKIFT